MAESIADKVKKIIAEQLSMSDEEKAKITEDSHLVTDLGADSLDAVELSMAFEDAFGVDISDKDAEQLTTVKAVVKFIEDKQKES